MAKKLWSIYGVKPHLRPLAKQLNRIAPEMGDENEQVDKS